MTAFPDLLTSVPVSSSFPERLEFRTLTTEFENGQETAKQKRLFPQRGFSLQYRRPGDAAARPLYDFFIARKGKLQPFSLFLPYSADYLGEYVGTGDGVTTLFNLPSRTAADFTVYAGGAELTETTDYTFTAGGGADGGDLLELVAAPAVGAYLTFDFTGILKVRCRFADDAMDYNLFKTVLAEVGLKLKGLPNA